MSQPDDAEEIVIVFRNEVLGPYAWRWEGLDAAQIFNALRPFFVTGMYHTHEIQKPKVFDLRDTENPGVAK